MKRCKCGMLAFRHRAGRYPVHPLRVWVRAFRYRVVWECYCGRVWGGSE